MTTRDRIVLMVVVVLAVLGAGWVLVVSPKRKEASKLDAQVAAAKSTLSSAESALASARAAQAQYATAYSSVVTLGKAVPAQQEVPSLIYQLSQATHQQNVEFTSIATTTSGAAGAATGAAGTAASAAGAAAAAGFSKMPFTFVFEGRFFALEHIFKALTGFADRTTSGSLNVRGRLLTVQGVKLAAAPQETGKPGGRLIGTITATAYQLPAGQGVTGGATPTSPAGSTSAAASTSAGASSATAPAIARVTP